MLVTLTDVMKTAVGVRSSAAKVVLGLEGLHESLTRCLTQARAALVTGAGTADLPAGAMGANTGVHGGGETPASAAAA
jgi:hypothetical protein